ncbi:MAG: peptidyl-prolyl cis-trans isomerase [Lachnospiraceae bacterium]|nr:peptidyl-prolyl cis-trans isomerase [Lachnospiraceae bacterium]
MRIKNIKKCAVVFTCVWSMFLLGGCANTKIVLTTGLAEDEIFRIGDVSCELSEGLVYLVNQKNQYENVYGIEMWDHDFGEMTVEEYLKSQIISQLAQVKSMILLAEEHEIVLDEQELASAAAAAADYYASLSQQELETLNIDQQQIQKMYEDYCLAYKAYDQITEDVSVEISDDEARIIQIQQIFVPERNLARELKEKLDEGESFESIAANYSKASQTTLSIARGDKREEYEAVAFDLNNEEISDVFEADGGYYILKCLDTYMEEESDANKLRVAQQQKTMKFQEIYEGLMKDTLSEYQEKLWNGVRFEDYEDVETCTFFDIYKKYFEA